MIIFYNRQIQQDSTECPMMQLEIINKGSVPYCGSYNNSTGLPKSDILFWFMLEKIYCLRCMWTEISLIWV